MAVVVHGGRGILMLLDPEVTQLVACFVGTDRRVRAAIESTDCHLP